MNIIEGLREYIKLCPHLVIYNAINPTVYVDFSNSEEATTYTIEENVTSTPIIKTYIDGSTERQYLFIFSSIESYCSDFDNNIKNINFYDNFAQWLEDNNKNEIFPTIGDKKEALKVEALTNGYLFNNPEDASTGRYMIQCKLTYYQEK